MGFLKWVFLMHRTRICILALIVSGLLILRLPGVDAPPADSRKTEEKALYDDGSLRFRVPLNAKGQRHGQFTGFYPGGKKMKERVRYERGERTGNREMFDEKGQIIGEEFWVAGKLVNPKSMRIIEAELARLLKEATTLVARMRPPTNPRAPKKDTVAHALAKVNAARFLADLPADVTLDDQYIDLTQQASELLSAVGHLTHTPEKPAGYDDKAYQLGREGCGHSNIYQGWRGGDPAVSIDGYLFDSDPGNIDRLGHRRWILNPGMGKTGFGSSGKFSAMYSMDRSRQDVPDYDFVCYPPRGLCPLNMFSAASAWHVSVNPRKFVVGNSAALEIFPVDAHLQHASHALELEYAHVDRGGFGINNAIIAKPNAAVVKPGVVYEVVVHGVETKDGKPAELSYYVDFYAPPGGTQ